MLNKQGPKKIDWCDYTWNPISGRCLHNCEYCYMHRFWRFPGQDALKLKAHYLDETWPKKASKIFVGSSTDMWGDWIPSDWIEQVLTVVRETPGHIFQFLTKNPLRYRDFDLPLNGWYGTTVDGTRRTEKNVLKLTMYYRPRMIKFVSFEPLLNRVTPDLKGLSWIIIGADSRRGAKKPPDKWADSLIQLARWLNIPVWVKDNFKYHTRIKELPECR